MDSDTDARASSERMESFLRSRADSIVEPAGWEESGRYELAL
jgi:hypothetical protein